MRTPGETIEVRPGGFVVHPRGEMHEYVNGPERSVLFRVRHGTDMAARILAWPPTPLVVFFLSILQIVPMRLFLEIASVLKLRLGTVKSRIARGRERLRQIVEGES